jgi:hypothetical protein
VTWYKRSSKWKVRIAHDGRKKHVGYFAREQEDAAARAYDSTARQLRGSKAHSSKFQLNFPTPEEQRNRPHPQLAPPLAQQPLLPDAAADDVNKTDGGELGHAAAAQTALPSTDSFASDGQAAIEESASGQMSFDDLMSVVDTFSPDDFPFSPDDFPSHDEEEASQPPLPPSLTPSESPVFSDTDEPHR